MSVVENRMHHPQVCLPGPVLRTGVLLYGLKATSEMHKWVYGG
jgi:hypothetical protein